MVLKRFILFYIFIVGVLSCSSSVYDDVEEMLTERAVLLGNVRSSSNLSNGALNAVKKAYQMTEISYTPINPIPFNKGYYIPGQNYKGLIYSSVKEIGTYVGDNVSFHTFMTAINNPRSVIYTENIGEAPYHGTNGHAYYGTVCSGLVSYALGIKYGSYDFPVSEVMQKIDHSRLENLEIADVLWRPGHVALITDVIKDSNDFVKNIEICEATQSGCVRNINSRNDFLKLMNNSFERVYRYLELNKNVNYTPATDFVAVLDEEKKDFNYNNDLCVNKGDLSCYVEGEDVVVNVLRGFNYLEVYKDDVQYITIADTSNMDIILQGLPYGDYKARIFYDKNIDTGIHLPTVNTRSGTQEAFSDFTFWKVVSASLEADRSNNRLYFNSYNAIPIRISFCNIAGSRGYPFTEIFAREIADEEKVQGYMDIPKDLIKEDRPYVQVTFSTDYGNVINRPFNWFEQK